MLSLKRTTAKNPPFVQLVAQLDAYLSLTDGEEHVFFHQFNSIYAQQEVVVAYWGDQAVGCGAMRKLDETTIEVKRMFTLPECRGKGIARAVLAHLEEWAVELGFDRIILETGARQPEAIALYQNCGYKEIDCYVPYEAVDNSHCFEKQLQM
ncbi:GNAT family N-acetyltransferase [Nonlabens xiamenensis]|uniref:GNAT family N-acetyltransferase n=1 Tax=Nonlabens xiamenensis TaxID=2341043 RepID=UPI000F615BA6|nr:GNAT family N-acetyltransferase [Nonlabens xiamenensis]